MREYGLLGRRPAKRPVGLRLLSTYSSLPAAPETFDYTNGFDGWGMYGNGPDPSLTVHSGVPVGDCGFAGAVHLEMATAAETKESINWPTSNEVVSEYLAYDHGVDQGVALADLLAYWRATGLWGRKIAAYAPVNIHDPDEMWAACNAFGALYIGVAVPAPAQMQFARHEPWELTGTAQDRQIIGGHCVVIVARAKGGGEVVTWGGRQEFTDEWLATYLEEAWVAITPEQVEAHGDGYGLGMLQLNEDLDRVQ